ncbi:SDR family NAD(P)-dependent oxidoreductase [Nocardioides dongxiaopingii]|uniref:SDR family NAD(P)-dependent oxidoreductase n=1 Tax=Nocardioides dongxiaopingii TaxID=2576036 RepID=UPI0010C76F30|nr:SDR family NAD(P)-dependent oxidoreductase [Nocardioides dongxiaopingii]
MATTQPAAPRAVLVVGASSGIGLAVAQRLSERGDRLVLFARDQGRLRQVADALPGPVEVVAGDVADADAVERAVEACVAAYGRCDAAISTAQAMAYGTVESLPPDVLRHLVDVAVGGTGNLARSLLPRFREQGGGHLVVVSSLLAEIAVPSMGGYCAAKWGQLGLVRTLQAEVRRERGVHVSVVLPGAVDTPIYRQAATYAGRLGSAPPPVVAPGRVAQACLRRLDRPRRLDHVGPANLPAVAAFRTLPALYERLAGPLVDRVVLRGPRSEDHAGNVLEPVPAAEGLRGGWTTGGRLRGRTGRARWRG